MLAQLGLLPLCYILRDDEGLAKRAERQAKKATAWNCRGGEYRGSLVYDRAPSWTWASTPFL